MSKQLYEEALADVKKLKEIAEDNAKRAILEAVTPRIKDLIENQLLGEAADDDQDDDLLLDMPETSEMGDAPTVATIPQADPQAASAISMPDAEGKVTLDLSKLAVPDSDDQFTLSMDNEEAVDSLVPTDKAVVVKAESKLSAIEKKINSYVNASDIIKETKNYLVGLVATINEVENMYSVLQRAQESTQKNSLINRLKECHKTLKQLMEQEMNTMNKFTLNEEDITLTLKGLPSEVDPDDVEIELVAGEEGEETEETPEEEESEEAEAPEAEEASEEDEESSEETSEGEKMEASKLEGDDVVEIDESMLRTEIARMRSLREETEPAAWGDGPGEVSDEFEEEDMGDALELDITTESEMKQAMKQGMKQAKHQDEAEHMDEKDMEEMYELDEMMHDEADEKDEAQHQKKQAKHMDEKDMEEMYELDQAEDDRAHGGNVAPESMGPGAKTNKQGRNIPEAQEKDEAKDMEEAEQKDEAEEKKDEMKTESLKRRLARETQIQAEAKKKAHQAKKMQAKHEAQSKKEKTQAKKMQAKKQAKKMHEAYVYYATQFNESVARTSKIQNMIAEASVRKGAAQNGGSTRLAEETVTLREKLAETNLFNAKLLFTNKLLQNESLTKRQKAEVIERLDEAQNIREVKLVYESLVKALQGGSTGRQISEGTTRGVVGSSSRPARPAATTSTLNEGYEADRWAKLAGIIK